MSAAGYVVYIDEAGDDGLYGPMKPDDPRGASEWMTMSAIVVRAENDTATVTWVREIISRLAQHQLAHLHFRTLRPDKKRIVCERVACLPIRIFVVMSHKRNMRNYCNLNAEKAKINRTAWFFCWLSRMLLERVSHYCKCRTHHDYGAIRPIRIEISDRGGVKIEDIRLYYKYLRDQSRMGLLYLNYWDLSWDVMDMDRIVIHPNRARAGLQLADVASSAFHHAVERTDQGVVRPEFARILAPRVCRRPTGTKLCFGYGLKVMPTWIPSQLPEDQRNIFDFYGRL